MENSRANIQANTQQLLLQLTDDWEYNAPITRKTSFIYDLELNSLDVVILGTITQEHYDQEIPFSELFASVGDKEIPDLTIGEWIDFIYTHLQADPANKSSNMVTS